MATFVASSGITQAGTASGTSLSKPAAGLSIGNIAIATVVIRGGTGITNLALSGWTSVTPGAVSNGTILQACRFWRIIDQSFIDAADAGAISFTGTTNGWSYGACVFSPETGMEFVSGSVIDNGSLASNGAASTTLTYAAMTRNNANVYVLATGFTAAVNVSAWTLTGFTSRIGFQSGTNSNTWRRTQLFGEVLRASAGTESAATSTITSAQSIGGYIGLLEVTASTTSFPFDPHETLRSLMRR